MGIRNKSRSQFRKRRKTGLNQSLIYPHTDPFPTLSPRYFSNTLTPIFFLFTRLQLSSQKKLLCKKNGGAFALSLPLQVTPTQTRTQFSDLTLNICTIYVVARQQTERPPRFAFTLCTRSVQLRGSCSRWDTNRGTWKPFAY